MNVLEHLAQRPVYQLELFGVDLSITNGVISIWCSCLLVFLLFFIVSRRLKPIPGRGQNLVEVVILFIRNEVAGQITHGRDKWLPFLVTLFAFILTNNLLGLIPGFSCATGNINTTAALALIIFLVVHLTGFRAHGFNNYLRNFIPTGIPWPIAVFMAPIEFVGQLARPFSLAVRLFANMFAGHAVMLMLISLIFIFRSYLIIPLPVIGDTAVLAFEIFICFIQAFIFTYLSALYIAIALEGE